jgi:hypothetical protein
MWNIRNAYRILIQKMSKNGQLEIRGGGVTITTDLRERGSEDGNWMELPEDLVRWWASVLTALIIITTDLMRKRF